MPQDCAGVDCAVVFYFQHDVLRTIKELTLPSNRAAYQHLDNNAFRRCAATPAHSSKAVRRHVTSHELDSVQICPDGVEQNSCHCCHTWPESVMGAVVQVLKKDSIGIVQRLISDAARVKFDGAKGWETRRDQLVGSVDVGRAGSVGIRRVLVIAVGKRSAGTLSRALDAGGSAISLPDTAFAEHVEVTGYRCIMEARMFRRQNVPFLS